MTWISYEFESRIVNRGLISITYFEVCSESDQTFTHTENMNS